MAITSTISLSPGTVIVGQRVTATLVVSNSGGNAVNVNSITPVARQTGSALFNASVDFGTVPLNPGFNQVVPASGSLTLLFDMVFNYPSTGNDGSQTGTYDVLTSIFDSTGTITLNTPATVIVNPRPIRAVLADYTKSTLTAASSVVSGASITCTLTLNDGFGNPIPSPSEDDKYRIAFSNSGGTSTGTFGAITNNGFGVYTCQFTGVVSGSATTISASIQEKAILSSLPTVTVGVGAASKIKFTQQPVGAVHANPLATQPWVSIEDAAGNVTASTANVTIAIGTNPSSGVLSGTLTVAAVAGVAKFTNAAISAAGVGYTLTAVSSGLTGDTSAAFTMT